MMDWTDEKYTPGSGGFDKSSVDIIDVLVKVGGRMSSRVKGGWWDDEVAVFCPFCSDATSRKPAGRANATKQVYHCWACGFGGDAISIARKYLETPDGVEATYEMAVRWLENEVAKDAR